MKWFRIAIYLLLLSLSGCALGSRVSSPLVDSKQPDSDESQIDLETKVQQMPRIRPWGRTREKGSGLAPEAKAIERSLGYQ